MRRFAGVASACLLYVVVAGDQEVEGGLESLYYRTTITALNRGFLGGVQARAKVLFLRSRGS